MARDGYYELSLDDMRRVVDTCMDDLNAGLTARQQREIVAIANRLLGHAMTKPTVEVKDPHSAWWKERG
jgi:hypothetical protein